MNNLYQFRNRSLLFLIIYWQCVVTVWSGAEYWSLLTYRAVLYIWLGFHNFFIRWEIGVSRFRLGGLISKYQILLVNFLEKKGKLMKCQSCKLVYCLLMLGDKSYKYFYPVLRLIIILASRFIFSVALLASFEPHKYFRNYKELSDSFSLRLISMKRFFEGSVDITNKPNCKSISYFFLSLFNCICLVSHRSRLPLSHLIFYA